MNNGGETWAAASAFASYGLRGPENPQTPDEQRIWNTRDSGSHRWNASRLQHCLISPQRGNK